MTPALTHIFTTLNSYEEFEQLRSVQTDFTEAIQEILNRHHIPQAELIPFSDGSNLVFAVGNQYVVKVFPPCLMQQFTNDLIVLQHLQGKLSVKTPAFIDSGELLGWPYIIMSLLPGKNLEGLWDILPQQNKLIIIRELGALIKEVHALDTQGLEGLNNNWDQFFQSQIMGCVEQHRRTGLPESLIVELSDFINTTALPKLSKSVLLTGEYTPMNFLVVEKNSQWHIDGLIDFGDARLGLPEYDLLGPAAFLIKGNKELLRALLLAYGYAEQDLNEQLSRQMTALMLLHEYSNLKVQVRIQDWQEMVTNLKQLQDLVWGL